MDHNEICLILYQIFLDFKYFQWVLEDNKGI